MWMRFVVAAVACLAAVSVVAQSHRASVRGVVLDPSGAPVSGAVLSIMSEATGESRSTSTQAGGHFTAAMLSPGLYRIEVEHPGHKKYTTQVELQVNQDLWLHVPLSLGDLTEEVFVNAPIVPLDRESAALGAVIDSRQLSGLPLDGRNFLELSLLAPGAAPAPQGSASSLRGDFAFTVNGAREDAHSFLLDGFYNTDPKLNTPGVRPPIDAIREFEVLTGTYDASFGRNAAGQVNVVTQSGTNAFHGTAYGFLRTKALDARNFFAPAGESAPDYSRGQFGGSLGGPIVANRTFFFADYEHTRLREGITRVANVPTLAERNGDFSQSLFPAPFNPFMQQPYPGGQIPPEFIHPIGRAIAALYPEPNRAAPLANFVSSPTLRNDADLFDVRLDHALREGATLTSRYSFNDSRFLEPFASSVSVPGFGTDVPRRAQNLGASVTQAFTPAWINEARFGYTRVAIGVFQENQGRSLNSEVGLPEISSNPRDFGLSQITVEGFTPLGDEFTTPQESVTDSFQIADSLTWARGAHLVKTGGEFRWIRQSAYRDVQSRGFLNFSSRYLTGNALADLLLGFPLLTGGAVLDNPQQLRAPAWSAFVQDDWRLFPNLTLTAGLRYEYVAPAADADDRVNLYDPVSQQLVPAGMAGIPRGGYEPDRNNFAPRIGVAWSPDAAGQTVLRGGYGLYFNQGALATGEGIYFNQPYFDFKLYALHLDPSTGFPPLTLQDPFPQGYPALPTSATAYQRDLAIGWLEHWSLSLQRQLGQRRAVEIAYVGSRGHDLIAARDLNQPAPSPVMPNLRPNPQFDDITFIESRGSSEYNALQLKFQQQLDRGVSVLAAYTLGKSSDDASGFFASAGDPNLPQDSRNPEDEFARSSFDLRHRFSMSFAWELPFGSFLRDTELQGILTLQSGPPFTIALLPEFDNSNTGRSTLGFGANDRPNVIGDPALDDPSADRWFSTTAFAVPPFGSFGDAPRNFLDGPAHQNINLGILKYLPIGMGEAQLQIRAEAFNLFNHANFHLPDAFLGSPTFGQVVSADSPRRCQFGLRLIF
jgi:outer membrane receptor protein involved in Fe transport